MSNTIGNTKDLDASRREALQGLLGSLGHVSGNPSSAATLSAAQVRKLSEKIKEILGGDTNHGSAREDQPNQLRSKDDLPIVDITEPVNEDPQTGTPSAYISEPELTPLSLLPPDEAERRRRERNRVLDLLEEEERLLQLKEERDAEEERKEAIRKRKESAKAELAHLKAARELQKKMGQALVRNSKGTGDDRRDEDARLKPQLTASSVPKKCVSFADAPAMEDDERDQQMSVRQPDWGGVTPGRLRAQNRIPLVSTAEARKYPMKMHVVERHPTTTTSPPHPDADSDDESLSAGNFSPHAGSDLLNEEDNSSSSDDYLSDNEPLEEAFDYDTAQHHREIALEYYKKRHAIGAETAKALAAHDLDDDERPESSIRQSPLSHFRADCMAVAYDKSHTGGPVSTPVGQTVIPASRQRSLRNSVRLGILEDDQLVGGDPGESGSEDEAVREMIEMLRMGNVENVGPDFQPSTVSAFDGSLLESTTVEMSGVARGDGIIKRTQDDQSWDNVRSQPVVSSIVERKAPKSSSIQRFPINKPPSRPPVNASEPSPPMIIHSPSFPITSTIVSFPALAGGTLSPNRTHAGYSSSGKPSAVQDSTIPSQASSRDSRFMAERKK